MSRRLGPAARAELAAFVADDPAWRAAIAAILAGVPADATRIVVVSAGIGWLAAALRRARPAAQVVSVGSGTGSAEAAPRLFRDAGVVFAAAAGPAGVAASAEHAAGEAQVVAGESVVMGAAEPVVGGAEPSWPGRRGAAVLVVSIPVGQAAGPEAAAVQAQAAARAARSGQVVIHAWVPAGNAGDASGVERAAVALAVSLSEAHPGSRALAGSAPVVTVVGGHTVVRAAGAADGPGMQEPAASGPSPARRVPAAPPAVDGNPAGRRRMVVDRLGIALTPAGTLVSKQSGPTVLVVSPNRNSAVETFVNAQLEALPTRVVPLFGIPPDSLLEDGARFVPTWLRAVRRLARWLPGGLVGRLESAWLDRFLRIHDVQVILADYGPTGVRLLDAARRSGTPLVTQFFGYDAYDEPTLEAEAAGYRRLLAEGAATVAVSREMQATLEGMGARPGSVHWVPCGADMELVVPARPAEAPPAFLAAGRFVEKKAPHLTLLAFARVADVVAGARLVMVGDGPLLEACVQLAGALGVAGKVEFPGQLPHEELAARMAAARVFVQHSMRAPTGDREGTPVAIVEAGAAGLPVVATRHAGIPDVVVDGETGFLVEEGDVAGMAAAMLRLATDPALAARLGAAARARVAAELSLELTAARLWSVLLEAMGTGSPGRPRRPARPAGGTPAAPPATAAR